MNLNEISGQRQLTFMEKFDYIREAGTEAEEKAAQTIQRELESFGVDSHLEEFVFDTWKITEAEFTVTQPYEKTYRVAGYMRCGNTPEDGVEAPFFYAENGDPISLSKAAGKIVMVNFPMDAEMYENLVKAGAAAFLTITGTPIDMGEDLNPVERNLRGVADTPIQGGIIHHADAIEMVTNGACRARFKLKQELKTVKSHNVVARIEGSDKAQEILTLTAHYDSVPAGKGAYDNMAGGAIIMEICRYFRVHTPRRSVEFVWFGAEEKGLKGSQAYVGAHEDELKNHQFNMNVDLAGQLVGGTVLGVAAVPQACTALENMGWEVGLGLRTINGIWGSDSNTFAWKGVPAMTLNRDGFGMHTHYDTIELISPWSLQRSAQLLGYIADSLGNAEEIPFPRTIPEELMEKLEQYFAQ
ncbi:MAG: M20/M25/M40 family metallo-hydrolase [Lachnospiraceae bacterium]|nr:M20/M25/M40 family metallo-hydrolase [Lachnospiraceae bacterium]